MKSRSLLASISSWESLGSSVIRTSPVLSRKGRGWKMSEKYSSSRPFSDRSRKRPLCSSVCVNGKSDVDECFDFTRTAEPRFTTLRRMMQDKVRRAVLGKFAGKGKFCGHIRG